MCHPGGCCCFCSERKQSFFFSFTHTHTHTRHKDCIWKAKQLRLRNLWYIGSTASTADKKPRKLEDVVKFWVFSVGSTSKHLVVKSSPYLLRETGDIWIYKLLLTRERMQEWMFERRKGKNVSLGDFVDCPTQRTHALRIGFHTWRTVLKRRFKTIWSVRGL